jgi:hypothetical protein
MIGTNPYEEWQSIYDHLSKLAHVWDADIGSWDNKMLAQLQDCVATVLQEKSTTKHPEVLKTVLELAVRAYIAILNKTHLSSHSVSSGIWITGFFNSLINRASTACAYYREATRLGKKPNITEFMQITDFVYGDDKLNGVPSHLSWFNAIVMRDWFESTGMTYTDGAKRPVDKPFSSLSEVSFLKRTFRYHPLINRVMCPLSLDTMYNSVQWLDSRKDPDVVLASKIEAFQREAFLHETGPELVAVLRQCCSDRAIPYRPLPISYLINLFVNDPAEAFRLYQESSGKTW